MTYEEARKELIAFKDKSWDGMEEEVIDKAIEGLGILSHAKQEYDCGGFIHSSIYIDTDGLKLTKTTLLRH